MCLLRGLGTSKAAWIALFEVLNRHHVKICAYVLVKVLFVVQVVYQDYQKLEILPLYIIAIHQQQMESWIKAIREGGFIF